MSIARHWPPSNLRPATAACCLGNTLHIFLVVLTDKCSFLPNFKRLNFSLVKSTLGTFWRNFRVSFRLGAATKSQIGGNKLDRLGFILVDFGFSHVDFNLHSSNH